MPTSISIAVLVLGAVLLLVAVTGGKFKIFGAEVSAAVSNTIVRLFSGAVGIILIFVALAIYALNSSSQGSSGSGGGYSPQGHGGSGHPPSGHHK
jgi:hypothetical protein